MQKALQMVWVSWHHATALPTPPQQHIDEGGGQSKGHSLAEPLDRLIQSCRRFVLGRDRKRENERKSGRNGQTALRKSKRSGCLSQLLGEAESLLFIPKRSSVLGLPGSEDHVRTRWEKTALPFPSGGKGIVYSDNQGPTLQPFCSLMLLQYKQAMRKIAIENER